MPDLRQTRKKIKTALTILLAVDVIEDLGIGESGSQRVPGAPGRVLGRPGLALPVGLPAAVRARAASGPHRLPRRRRPPVTGRLRRTKRQPAGVGSAWRRVA